MRLELGSDWMQALVKIKIEIEDRCCLAWVASPEVDYLGDRISASWIILHYHIEVLHVVMAHTTVMRQEVNRGKQVPSDSTGAEEVL